MSHGHLCLELGNGLKSNTDNDQQRRAAECDTAYARAGDKVNDDREYGNDVKEQRADKSDPAAYLSDVLNRRSAGTDTSDRAAVLLKVASDLDRIERDLNIELSERNYQKEHRDRVEPGIVREKVYDMIPYAAFVRLDDKRERGRQGDDRACEDDRHNTGHIQLDRQIRGLTAVHLATDNLLSILYGNPSLTVGNEDNEHDDYERCNDDSLACNDVPRTTAYEEAVQHGYDAGSAGEDVCEEDERDTVSDTELVDLLSHPHYKRRACGIARNDYERSKHLLTLRGHADKSSGGLDVRIVTVGGDETETDGDVTSDSCDLFSALLALALQSFKSRNGDGEQLHNDGSRDIRLDRQCKQCCTRECLT